MSDLYSPTHTPATGGRHRVNVGHLVMGVAFVGLTTIWALNISGAVTGDGTRFLFPLPWVAAGVAGLLAALVSKRRRDTERRAEAARRVAAVEEQALLHDHGASPTLPISLDKKDDLR